MVKITENSYFKTELGSVVSWNDLKKAIEIVYGNHFGHVVDDFNIYIPNLIKGGYAKVTPITTKQAYDYALNQNDKILALKTYRTLREEQTGEYYSLIKAKKHVEEVLERKEKRKAYIALYHEIQEKFCDHVAFITHWEILCANAKDIYKRLKKEYGDKKESVTEEVALDYICNLHKCSRACAKEVFQVMTLNSSIIKKGEVWGFMK